MQDIFGSVPRSLSLRPTAAGDATAGTSSGSIADRIGSRLRKSRVGLGLGLVLFPKPHSPPSPIAVAPTIRWRKGELIGCGAFGHVYMGLNLDSGELLAVKQVMIGSSDASKAKSRDHIRELEEEIKLLKNLSHPNNVVIRMYTKQLLLGLEYLHRNKIMHKDIKGAIILVDNRGCIKLADFGASKQVAQLATITAAKSMKGTPYWMAPEVIVHSGHSLDVPLKAKMVNFGKKLMADQVEEWKGYCCINYKLMKKRVNQYVQQTQQDGKDRRQVFKEFSRC